MLFVSGEKAERFQKALDSGADMVCIDLEDAVAPSGKARARESALAFAAQHLARETSHRVPQLAIRINSPRTKEGLEDVLHLTSSGVHLDALLLPKVEHPEELFMLQGWCPAAANAWVALIETPRGIEKAAHIAAASKAGAPALAALMLGGADLSNELGARFNWEGLLWARGRLVNAAKSANLQAWDVPNIDLADPAALREETQAALAMGFDCKSAIHPSQIDVIHAVFNPSAETLAWAKDLLKVLAQRANEGLEVGAFMHAGRMIDAPLVARAQRVVQLAEYAN